LRGDAPKTKNTDHTASYSRVCQPLFSDLKAAA
jgi:hypothetical protein